MGRLAKLEELRDWEVTLARVLYQYKDNTKAPQYLNALEGYRVIRAWRVEFERIEQEGIKVQ